MIMSNDTTATAPSIRIRIGFGLFIISLAGPPILIPLLPLLGVSKATMAAVTGGLLVGAELLLLAGAAVAGKDGYAYIKKTVFGFIKSYGPPEHVSSTRYSIGLVLFIMPILLGWATPYFGGHLPGFNDYTMIYAITGDFMLAISLFVLGGEFWDKLRSLFIHSARAAFD
jgi:hypothetical protein